MRKGTGRIPALDGVRGFAILAVMLYHSGVLFGRFEYPGGFVGVDVFFVLSGFLITSLLVRERRTEGGVKFAHFYARRALRLLPALLIMLALAPVAVWALGGNNFGRPLSTTVVIAVTYLANWFQTFGDGTGVFPHIWSLAIEEQYYLLWPVTLVFFLGRRLATRRAAAITALCALVVAVLRGVIFHQLDWYSAYFWTITRTDGVLLGSALGLLLADPPAWTHILKRREVGVAALALIIIPSVWLAPETAPLYNGLLLVCVLGATALVGHIAVGGTSIVQRVMDIGSLRYVGRISYGLYLFHPLIVFIIVGTFASLNRTTQAALAAGIAIAFASASFQLIERRVLALKSRFQPVGEQTLRREPLVG